MRIVIADDSALIREGLRLIFTDAGHQVVAGVGDGPSLVATALELRPDLVISDIRMPPAHTDEGLQAARQLRAHWPDAPILLLSQYVVLSYADELLTSGSAAIGYLLKDRVSDIDRFLASAERVASGGTVLDPEVVAQLLGRRRAREPIDELTPRERDVLELMAEGHTNAGIASKLFISEGAVEKNAQRIFAKLGLSTDDAVHRRVMAVLAWLRDDPVG